MELRSKKHIDGAAILRMIFDPETPGFAFLSKEEVMTAFDATERTLLEWRKKGFPGMISMPGGSVYNIEAIREFLRDRQREAVRNTRAALK